MGEYRVADAFLIPSLLSMLRLPLAIGFVLWIDNPPLALLLLIAGGASDVLDGWYARRFNQATPTGAVIDGVMDKGFMAIVVAALLFTGALELWHAVLLATREIGELPLVLWWATHRAKRRARAEDPKANAIGKLCTIVQFLTVSGALFNVAWLGIALLATGGIGAVAAAYYWIRETRA